MSDPKLISPLLDNFIMGGSISEHHGISCYPAMRDHTEEKYIVKIISVPANPSQIDALLLSGAFSNEEAALAYFKDNTDNIIKECDTLKKLSDLEGFTPYESYQVVEKESGKGYDVYLLSTYKRTLEKFFKRHVMTHLDALNLGLDLCAALAVCRRSGFLFADLKPGNIFVTGDHQYKIGDLGFIHLNSLQYTSLPEKYLSNYTPPEITDAFSTLNTSIDTYAAGLILYQAYNNGALPFNDSVKPGDSLPAPLYADYEMSEIILKACAVNPDDRWHDPMAMGQAIISYMQRNGALDTPIVPTAISEQEVLTRVIPDEKPLAENTEEENLEDVEASDETSGEITEEIDSENIDVTNNIVTYVTDLTDSEVEYQTIESDTADSTESNISKEEHSVEAESITESSPEFSEDSFGNLSFLGDFEDSEDDIYDDEENYDSITDEVSEILNQADELAALVVPDPVEVPDPIEINLEEIIPPQEEQAEDVNETSRCDIEVSTDEEDTSTTTEDKESEEESSQENTPDLEYTDHEDSDTPVKKKRSWLLAVILILLLIGIFAGGYYYYQNYYILPVETYVLDGNENSLIVMVETDKDETLLEVICTDSYGNQLYSPVINGKAEFHNLVPDTAYSVKVVSKGFHRLTGHTATAYSTPVQSNIVQFDAITGNTDGSVILSFAVEGPNCDTWSVHYGTEGEEERVATFNSHIVTLTDLTIGKEYSFRLVPEQELCLTGQTEIFFTPSALVTAENLTVTSCMNQTIQVSWKAPENIEVLSWAVRCYNDNYNETKVTNDLFATFENLNHNESFTVEVKALGMSISRTIVIPENSVTVTNFQIDTTNPTILNMTWETSREISLPDGWILKYQIEGTDVEKSAVCQQNNYVLTPVVPNATYRIHLEDVNGNDLLGSEQVITTGEVETFYHDFSGYSASKDDLIFSMCKTPSVSNWTRDNLTTSDYTTAFSVGESASFLVQITKRYNATPEIVTTMFVIRNTEGLPLYVEVTSDSWMNMWYRNFCELDVPVMPAVAGEYTMEVYFNGELATTQPFTVI